MVADNCFYVDHSGQRHNFVFSDQLKHIYFVGPRGQDFILESNSSGAVKFYALYIRRNGQQIMRVNDFITQGEQKDFNNRKVGWIVDLDHDGIMDILQREKLQIHRSVLPAEKNKNVRSQASAQIYKSDSINFRVWDKTTNSFLEKPFQTLKQRQYYYKNFDFKFNWKD